MSNLKGTLKLISYADEHIRFISDDGEYVENFSCSKKDIVKYFCDTDLEGAKKGVEAQYNPKSNHLQTTMLWTRQAAGALAGMDFKFSHTFI